MLKKLLIVTLIILTVSFSVGCLDNDIYPVTKTIVTDYGETFEIELDDSGNMHNYFIKYRITSENGKKLYISAEFFWGDEISPEDAVKLIEPLVQTEYVRLYKLQDRIIFSSETDLGAISDYYLDYNFTKNPLKEYTQNRFELYTTFTQEEKESFLHTFENVLDAFVETKQLKYIYNCAPLLLEKESPTFISLVERWAAGDISEAELVINTQDGFSKNDLENWAKQIQIPENNNV